MVLPTVVTCGWCQSSSWGKRKGTQPGSGCSPGLESTGHLWCSGHGHSVDPGRDHYGCFFFFAGSLGLEKLSGPKRSTSLLQWHMSQHESFRDYMYKSKHVCPTCALTSLNEEGTKGKLWRLQRESHNFQTVLQPEGKRAAGCRHVCDTSQMKPCTPSNYLSLSAAPVGVFCFMEDSSPMCQCPCAESNLCNKFQKTTQVLVNVYLQPLTNG